MRAERDVWIFLNQIPNLGPMRFHRLLEFAGSALAIQELSPAQLRAAEVSEATANEWHRLLRDPSVWARVDKELEREARGEFRILAEVDEGYPEGLRPLVDRPAVVYVKGIWPIPRTETMGIVGTRQPSAEGRQMADLLARQLSRSGVAIISGLAIGVDGAAHQAALESRGYTVAALGHGLAHQYPRQNRKLYREIPEQGCLITEFPFEAPPDAGHFPRRNRIISGLSNGVLIIEAGIKSGALITARYAAEQGKEVFAVPGSVLNPMAAGCNHLIKEGARLVEGIYDLLEAPNLVPNEPVFRAEPVLEGLEKEIFSELRGNLLSVDQLVEKLACSIDLLANALLSLELKGIIQHHTGQLYGIKN